MRTITIEHKHAKCYLISSGEQWILYDALWSDSFRVFAEAIKNYKIKLADIKYLVVSHFHIDHAGLTQVLKDYGITLLLHEKQVHALAYMNDFFIKKPDKTYKPILEENNKIVSSKKSRELLSSLGIIGEILSTPAHTPDSVSLVIDSSCAFVGDLRPELVEFCDITSSCCEKIKSFGVSEVYPAHGDKINLV